MITPDMPVSVPCPDCNTGGYAWDRGWDPEHRGNRRPILDCDHIYCPNHGDVGHDYSHGRCQSCDGQAKVTLRVIEVIQREDVTATG